MKAIAPSPESIRNAFYLGRTLAMTDPSFTPLLDDAAAHPNYVLFILAHRKKLEALPAFWTWDLRLEDMIEDEIENNGISLIPENVEVILQSIAMPLRCAFWLGWENVQNLQKKYEQATGNHSAGATTEVLSSDLQAAKGDLGILDPSSQNTGPEPTMDPSSPIT